VIPTSCEKFNAARLDWFHFRKICKMLGFSGFSNVPKIQVQQTLYAPPRLLPPIKLRLPIVAMIFIEGNTIIVHSKDSLIFRRVMTILYGSGSI